MEFTNVLFSLIVILISAKIFGEISTRMGQSSVVGELIAGVILGGSVLRIIQGNEILHIFAQIGVILLLFEVGLSFRLNDFLKVGLWSIIVATLGVIFPFILGYLAGLTFGLSFMQSIFVGATLTATSIGITAKVFLDLKKLDLVEAKIILGAAVIDDVIGLAMLAVVTNLATTGNMSIGNTAITMVISVVFLSGCLILGTFLAPKIVGLLKQMQNRGMLTVSAFVFCLTLSYFAEKIGLAAIIGAFASGLILASTDSKAHLQERFKPVANIFVPIFFVLIGTQVNINIFNPTIESNRVILSIIAILLIVAIIGKVLSGFGVFQKRINKLLIGVGMIPRGEVGLIFASVGISLKVVDASLYSALVTVVILTTFITPILIKVTLREQN